jgi:hypothetical protein
MTWHVFLSILDEAQLALGWGRSRGHSGEKGLPTNFVSPIQKLPLYQ